METRDYQLAPIALIKQQAKQAKKGQSVFFGDSIIEYWDLAKYELTGYNCGVRGATTFDLLGFHHFAIGDYQPERVIISVGVNDLSDENQFNRSEVTINLYELIMILQQKYFIERIIIISPLPIDENRQRGECLDNARLRLLGEEFKGVCEEFDGVDYLDCFNAFISDGALNDDYTSDGLHLNDAGYTLLTTLLKAQL